MKKTLLTIEKEFDHKIVYPINRNPKAELSDHSGYIYFGLEAKTVKKIKSFYRQQILDLFKEIEGKIPKKYKNSDKDKGCLESAMKGSYDDCLWESGYNTAINDIKAILKKMRKEII